MPVAIIKCGMCESKFDVSSFKAGATIKCGKCKSLLEVPEFRHRHQSSVTTLDAPTTRHEINLDTPLPEIPRKKKERDKTALKEREREPASRGKRDGGSRMRRKDERNEARRRTTRRVAPEDLSRKEGGGPSTPVVAGAVALLVVAVVVGGILISRSGGAGRKQAVTTREPSKQELFDERYIAAGSSADKLWELAGWCEEQKLESRRHKVLLRLVELHPDHTAGNQALGRVRYDGRWIDKARHAKILARIGPLIELLGKRVLRARTPHFDLLLERMADPTDEMAVDQEKNLFSVFEGQLVDYMKGFWQRKKEDFDSYSRNRRGRIFRKPSDLPRRTLAIFTTLSAYKEAAEKLQPRAALERGWYDAKRETIFLFHDGSNNYGSTFYDSFLFETYFANEDRNPNVSILWEKGMASLKYLSKEVDVSLSEHFLVAVETGTGYSAKLIANAYTDKLEALYDTFARNFKEVMATRQKMQMMPIYIFKERAGYLRYGRQTNKLGLLAYAGGHYEPQNRIMMTFRTEGKSRAMVVLHEGTHLLMHYLSDFKPKKPQDLFWFQEGIADYFAGFTHNSQTGKIILGHPNQVRLEHFKPRIHNALPLKQFVTYSQMTWARVVGMRGNPQAKHTAMMQVYTQGWALSHFLMHGEGGKYRERFLKFIDSALHGNQTYQDFQRCFGTLDYNTLHQEFVRYILALQI